MLWFKNKKTQKRKPKLMEGQEGYVFRRSRTLTGTTSAQVNAGAEKRGLLKTQRLKLHELRLHRLHFLKAAGGVVAVMGVVVYLASVFISTPLVQYGQTGVHTPKTSDYQATARKYLDDHPLERFGFALNPSEFERYLKAAHAELRSIAMDRAWYGGDVSFTFFFREPLLVWQTGGQQFYVDDQGIAFTYNYFDDPTVVVTDQSGISPEAGGGAVASTRFISFLGRMVGAINGYNKGRVESVLLPASTRQIDLKLEGRAYPVKTHIDRDPLEQAEDISNALAFFDGKGIKPEYVDVRVASKAFYK